MMIYDNDDIDDNDDIEYWIRPGKTLFLCQALKASYIHVIL